MNHEAVDSPANRDTFILLFCSDATMNVNQIHSTPLVLLLVPITYASSIKASKKQVPTSDFRLRPPRYYLFYLPMPMPIANIHYPCVLYFIIRPSLRRNYALCTLSQCPCMINWIEFEEGRNGTSPYIGHWTPFNSISIHSHLSLYSWKPGKEQILSCLEY
jgi:hypothetical protein